MNSNQFRKELIKIMPGYRWTVHRSNSIYNSARLYLSATGIQTAGFNRLSTLEITRTDKEGSIKYYAKSSGFGGRAPWLSEYQGLTLAQALRGLQNYYSGKASQYANHAGALESGRNKTG